MNSYKIFILNLINFFCETWNDNIRDSQIANWKRQFPSRFNSQKCLELKMPTIGAHTLAEIYNPQIEWCFHFLAADAIGLPYPPPYLAPTSHGKAILQGVNYASGAGGLLDESGANYVS